MKKLIFLAGFLTVMMAHSLVYAEMIQGEVLSVDLVARSLVVTRIIPLTGDTDPNPESETVQILVLPDTKFEGITDLGDLRSGDEIWADVMENKDANSWSARTIKIDKVNIQNQEEAK